MTCFIFITVPRDGVTFRAYSELDERTANRNLRKPSS